MSIFGPHRYRDEPDGSTITEDEHCPAPNDSAGTHCDHWWDGDACCYCKAPPMTDEEKRAKGMEEGKSS